MGIVDTLARNGIKIDSFQAILDFGCGCGRVIRYWHTFRNTVVFGTDYKPKLVEWCKRHLKFAQFEINQLSPPLIYRNSSFDFIYALSVFTHLSELLQHQWMGEFLRVLRPGGYLLITTHGKHYFNRLTQSEKESFGAGSLIVRYQEVAGTNMCSVFHPEGYVRQGLARSFDVVNFVPEGAKGNPYQDIYLLKKPIF